MERPALFVGDAEEGESTLEESQVRDRMQQGIPPESAEEYLLRVRIESKDLPAVVEAHVPEDLKKKQTHYMPSTEPVPSCAAYLLPAEDWERNVLSTFVDLRQYLRRWKATAGASPAERQPVPALKDSTGWHIFCLGCADDEEDSSETGYTRGRTLSEHQRSAAAAAASAAAPTVTASSSAGVTTKGQAVAANGKKGEAGVGATVGGKDPRNDDDAQSSFCLAPVETSSRFDKFTTTLANTTEAPHGDGEESEHSVATAADSSSTQPPASTTTTITTTASTTAPASAATAGAHQRQQPSDHENATPAAATSRVGVGDDTVASPDGTPKKPTGREWLVTHPQGTPPTMKLAIQFDQVLTQKVLAFHADWLRDNLLSRARAAWIYTLLACLEKPLGSETAALVREILRRCCAQRAEVDSPLDDNLPALNIIAAISGRFFQQAETN